jgi:hypothetical protein
MPDPGVKTARSGQRLHINEQPSTAFWRCSMFAPEALEWWKK